MKKLMTLALMALALTANAQEKKTVEVPQWVSNIKFSGYGMLLWMVKLATLTGVHRFRAPTLLVQDSPPYSW